MRVAHHRPAAAGTLRRVTTVERPTASWQPPALLAGTAVGLTALASLLGTQRWPTPTRTTSGWQVADVAPSLLAVVVGSGLVCLAVAAVLVTPRTLGSRLAAATWWGMAVASVLAQVWNDLYFAALAGGGPIIPVFNWLFAFVPAMVVGLVTRRHGTAAHLRATIGTAVVTLPMLGLGWALATQQESALAALAGGLYTTAFFGVLPLLVAVVITRPRS